MGEKINFKDKDDFRYTGSRKAPDFTSKSSYIKPKVLVSMKYDCFHRNIQTQNGNLLAAAYG